MSTEFQDRLAREPTAAELILSLFAASNTGQMSASRLVAGGQAFGLNGTAVRVALTRHVKAGTLTTAGRGVYAVSDEGRGIYGAIRDWKQYPNRTKAWGQGWVGAFVGHLGRTERKQVSRQERAFLLTGMREAVTGLWLRPDNLAVSLGGLTHRLTTLGMDPASLVAKLEVSESDTERFSRLYNRSQLELGYEGAIAAMRNSRSKLAALSPPQRAKETLMTGGAVIHLLTYDALLPSSLVDTQLRDQVFEDMCTFDLIGQNAWAEYLASVEAI